MVDLLLSDLIGYETAQFVVNAVWELRPGSLNADVNSVSAAERLELPGLWTKGLDCFFPTFGPGLAGVRIEHLALTVPFGHALNGIHDGASSSDCAQSRDLSSPNATEMLA